MFDVTSIIINSSAFLFAFLLIFSIIRGVNSNYIANYTQEQLDSAKRIDITIYVITAILFIVFIVSYSVKPKTKSRYRRFSNSDFNDVLYSFMIL